MDDVLDDDIVDVEEVETSEVAVANNSSRNVVDLCIICNTDIKGDTPQRLSSVGMPAFLEVCAKTNNQHLIDIINSRPVGHVRLHRTCRTRLNRAAQKIDKFGPDGSTSGRCTRSSSTTFDYRSLCLYCTKTVVGCPADSIRKVSTLEFDENLRSCISKRGYDDWALQVQGRLENVNDLHASDAVYHLECHVRFKRNVIPENVHRGRPINCEAHAAFLKLCEMLECEGENELYTLSQLHSMMISLCGISEEKAYSMKRLRGLLVERYGDTIYFASRQGSADVVGFKNMCDLILHDKLSSDSCGGSAEEKIVKKAAALILAEIRATSFDKSSYPNAEDIVADGTSFLPNLLKTFMSHLINDKLKQASIGQAVVQASKPRSSIMPLMFGIGVELSRCGNRQLHNQLCHLGFSISYSEMRQFKQSVVLSYPSITPSDVSSTKTNVSFAQYVADNFDHNVRTLDGHGTFHGMGIISCSLFPPGNFGRQHKLCNWLYGCNVTY